MYSTGVLHCGKNMLPSFPAGRAYLPFMGEFVESLPHHVFDFRRSRGEEGLFEDRATKGGFDELEAWKGVVREFDRRGVGECRVFGEGAVEILVSEKGDWERLVGILKLLPEEQRRKYKITLGVDYVSILSPSSSVLRSGSRVRSLFVASSLRIPDASRSSLFSPSPSFSPLQRVHHHIGPDTRLPAPPKPPPIYFGGGGP